MRVQTAAASFSLAFVALACGSTRSEMQPVAQSQPAASQPAPAVATTAVPAAAPAGSRSLVAPGATGHVNRDVDDNGNLLLQVVLEHLPPPADLEPSLRTYVVWIRAISGGTYQNVGQLVLDSNRRGELSTTTPHADVEVIVTAEASATPSAPSNYTVLHGSASRK